MFVFLELALTKDEVQHFRCMEKVAENQRRPMTCSGLWAMWKADLVSKPSFSDAKVCSFILSLKFLVGEFWVSSEGARECMWLIFISLIYTFLKIISSFAPILSEFVAIFWTLGVFGSTFEGQHLFKGKKGEHWKKFSIVFTLFICWLFQHQVLNLLTGRATLVYIRKGKGLVSGIECGVPFSDGLTWCSICFLPLAGTCTRPQAAHCDPFSSRFHLADFASMYSHYSKNTVYTSIKLWWHPRQGSKFTRVPDTEGNETDARICHKKSPEDINAHSLCLCFPQILPRGSSHNSSKNLSCPISWPIQGIQPRFSVSPPHLPC